MQGSEARGKSGPTWKKSRSCVRTIGSTYLEKFVNLKIGLLSVKKTNSRLKYRVRKSIFS